VSQVIFKGSDPFDDESWSNAIHFEYEGYDPSPWWDDDGQAYIVAGHSWRVAYGFSLLYFFLIFFFFRAVADGEV
jgi:beta-xylosidase